MGSRADNRAYDGDQGLGFKVWYIGGYIGDDNGKENGN